MCVLMEMGLCRTSSNPKTVSKILQKILQRILQSLRTFQIIENVDPLSDRHAELIVVHCDRI